MLAALALLCCVPLQHAAPLTPPAEASLAPENEHSADGGVTVHVGFLTMGNLSVLDGALAVTRQASQLTSARLLVHLVTDLTVPAVQLQIPSNFLGKVDFQIHDMRRLPGDRKAHFSVLEGAFKKNGFFMYKPFAHEVLPPWLDRIIMLDTDIVVQDDIALLWREFDSFDSEQLFGMALEMDLAYRGCHIPPHKDTRTYQGFNGGVQLLSLAAMRRNPVYNYVISPTIFQPWFAAKKSLCTQKQDWVLGDQDFYAVLAESHPEWYHALPCRWNIQLCAAWMFSQDPQQYRDWPQACDEHPGLIHACGDYKTWVMSPAHELLSCDVMFYQLGRAPPMRSFLVNMCGQAFVERAEAMLAQAVAPKVSLVDAALRAGSPRSSSGFLQTHRPRVLLQREMSTCLLGSPRGEDDAFDRTASTAHACEDPVFEIKLP